MILRSKNIFSQLLLTPPFCLSFLGVIQKYDLVTAWSEIRQRALYETSQVTTTTTNIKLNLLSLVQNTFIKMAYKPKVMYFKAISHTADKLSPVAISK